jgi:hypothetical protein
MVQMTGFSEATYGNYIIRKCIIEYSLLRTFSAAQHSQLVRDDGEQDFHRNYLSYEVFKTLIN